MNSSLLKKAVPHAIAIVIFLVIAIAYCKPAFDGKILNQVDVIGHTAMAKQSFDFNEKGKEKKQQQLAWGAEEAAAGLDGWATGFA